MSLRLTVHRGTNQIGGTCIEIAHSSGDRLILDAGRPLDAPRDEQGLLPSTLCASSPATILICHSHQDHWGILHEMPVDWSVWTGPISEKLIRLGYSMSGYSLEHRFETWDYSAPVRIGPFTLTPWLTDHSAPDAAMLMIEAEGQRIFYTGDFRLHGRKGKLVTRVMANPPKNIDVLITEGTNLGTSKPTVSEDEIERRFIELIEEVSGRIFVYWSAQNVDRTVSLFRAVRRRRKRLFVDLYTAEIMDIVGSGTRLPRVNRDFPELSLVVTAGQRRVRKRTPDQDEETAALIERCKSSGQAISLRQLPEDAVVMIRDSSLRDFANAGISPTNKDAFVFSSWAGYADTIAAKTFAVMKEAEARIQHIHTSGHVAETDLRDFINALAPKKIVPVHGENWARDHAGLPELLRLADGEVYELGTS